MTRRLPLAFYANAIAMVLFFIATQISRSSVQVTLQWLGGAAVLIAVALLIRKK